jgi:hypothetical protein
LIQAGRGGRRESVEQVVTIALRERRVVRIGDIGDAEGIVVVVGFQAGAVDVGDQAIGVVLANGERAVASGSAASGAEGLVEHVGG